MTDEEYEARVSKGQSLGWVYFIQTGPASPIKIGWAKDPAVRLKKLQTGQAEELALLAVIPGTRLLESDFHRRLRTVRLMGEWFDRGRVLRIATPVIREHGLFLAEDAAKSRRSPEQARSGRYRKREFYVAGQ